MPHSAQGPFFYGEAEFDEPFWGLLDDVRGDNLRYVDVDEETVTQEAKSSRQIQQQQPLPVTSQPKPERYDWYAPQISADDTTTSLIQQHQQQLQSRVQQQPSRTSVLVAGGGGGGGGSITTTERRIGGDGGLSNNARASGSISGGRPRIGGSDSPQNVGNFAGFTWSEEDSAQYHRLRQQHVPAAHHHHYVQQRSHASQHTYHRDPSHQASFAPPDRAAPVAPSHSAADTRTRVWAEGQQGRTAVAVPTAARGVASGNAAFGGGSVYDTSRGPYSSPSAVAGSGRPHPSQAHTPNATSRSAQGLSRSQDSDPSDQPPS
jgi:hypothetical protein